MTQHSFVKKALLLSGVALFSFAVPAQAGFEWKGPLETPHAAMPAPEAPSMQAVPAMPVDSQPMGANLPAGATPDAMDSMAPVTDPSAMNNNAQNDSVPVTMGSWSKDAQTQAAAMPASNKPAAAPMMNNDAAMPPMDMAANNSASGTVLSGFGSDLPLVIALQQIVPPGYQYSFTNGVNPGTTVSWEGGKPWQQVLGDTLQKQNLGYRVQNNTVVIGTFGNARSMDDASGMNDAPAKMAAPAPQMQTAQAPAQMTAPEAMAAPMAAAPAPEMAQAPAATHEADMPAPLWDSPADNNTAANNTSPAMPAKTATGAPVRTPIISPSNSSNRASRLPADLGGYAANASDGSSTSAAQNSGMSNDADSSMAATNNSMGNSMDTAPAAAPAPAADTAAVAPAATTPAANGKPETVVIHRQKPSSLFQRLGWANSPNRDQRNAEDMKAASMPAAPASGSAADAAAGDNLVLPPPSTATENVSASAKGANSQPERMASAASPQPLSMNDSSPAATPVSAATAGAASGWSANRGDSLHDVLTAWSNRAGVKLYWSIDYDYKLNDNAAYAGNYDEAVGDLLGKFSSVRPQPYGQLHQSADGSRVLVVKSYDLTR